MTVLLLFGLPVVLGIASSVVLRAVGFSAGQAAARATAVATLSLIAGGVFAFDDTVYSISEGGPEYYTFSPYMRYRRLDGAGLALTVLAYQLAPAALLTAAFAIGHSERRRWLPPLPSILALAAVALPLLAPAMLPRTEYGKDPVLHVAGPASLPRPGAPYVESCFLYGVERIGVSAPDSGAATARLCLHLADTPEARQLVSVDYEEGAPTIYDIAYALNTDGVEPFDQPQEIDIDGLQLRDARWTPA